jgi:hypothetical protein
MAPRPYRFTGDMRMFIDTLENVSIDPSDSRSRKRAFWYWQPMIHQWLSVLELSNEKDRLAAFPGLAKEWKEPLIDICAWTLDGGHHNGTLTVYLSPPMRDGQQDCVSPNDENSSKLVLGSFKRPRGPLSRCPLVR